MQRQPKIPRSPARSSEPCAVVAATPTARPARAQAVTRSRRQRRVPSCRGARRSRRAKGGLQPAARSRSAAGRAHKNAPPLDVSAASKATDATSDMRDATVRRLDGSLRPQGQPRRPPLSAKKASTAQPRNRERATETLQRPARSRAEACPKPHAARVGRLEHPGRRPSKPKLCWGHGRISLVVGRT